MHANLWGPGIRFVVFGLLTGLGLAGLGCGGGGPTFYPVSGKVLVQDRDGTKPAAGARLIFHPKKDYQSIDAIRPTAIAEEDGSFTLTWGTTTGAPAGEYLVTVQWPEVKPTVKKGIGIPGRGEERAEDSDRLKGRYNDQT